MQVLNNECEPWKVTLIDTGADTMTGGRLKRVKEYLGNETFCMTYGDGVSDVKIDELINFHRNRKPIATLTAVQEPGRFGSFTLAGEQDIIEHFREKPVGRDTAWINGGFFVLEPEIFNYITDDSTIFERGPLEILSRESNLLAFKHEGFWMPMDTLRDKNVLEEIWASGKAPWKVWE
jgi:glucose-1-phosphate cytidylyltransferase